MDIAMGSRRGLQKRCTLTAERYWFYYRLTYGSGYVHFIPYSLRSIGWGHQRRRRWRIEHFNLNGDQTGLHESLRGSFPTLKEARDAFDKWKRAGCPACP